MIPMCIYHKNCADGFGAAWVVNKYFHGEVEFIEAAYGDPPPNVMGRNVIMVDFSYPLETILRMRQEVISMVILDHHESARDALSQLYSPPPNADAWFNSVLVGWPPSESVRAAAQFDMNRSGAGMTWDWFYPDTPRPQLINHIEDRDMWRFNIPRTREIQSALFSYPYEMYMWDKFMEYSRSDLETFANEGMAIERKHIKDIHELLPITTRAMVIGGYTVPVANLPYTLASDAAQVLAYNANFAATYYDGAKRRFFSLRSNAINGFNVANIAKTYGGGGHKHAAGFNMPIGWEGDCTLVYERLEPR